MNISFYGAAKTVTGSCYLIETAYTKFLVDCGMFQGKTKESEMNNELFSFDLQGIDFMLLTHSHIDHSGRIPMLYKNGFRGQIFTTKASAELCRIMLPDSGHIQEVENEWLNRKRERAGKPPVEPIYTFQDALDSTQLLNPVMYGEIVSPNKGIKVRFNDAGHILGSSIIEIWVEENGKETKIVFSGDLGNKNMPILRDPSIIESADYLVIESTYGNRLHSNNENKVEMFVDLINETISKGGNVIIPSFAVGRTQEIIYDLHKQREKFSNKWDALMKTPVYIDSPLAISATQVFRNNLDCFDEEARKYIENGDNPLDFPGLQFTKTAEDSKGLNEKDENMIIISASGMCEAGRIKHHLKHNLWRKESTIIFVGYQAIGTLGRKLVDGAKKVKIFGEEITVNAKVVMLEGFSGHADRDGLLDWISKIRKKPQKIFIVHGEEDVMKDFSESIKQKFKIDCVIPDKSSSYMITAGSFMEITKDTRIPQQVIFRRLALVELLETLREELEDISDTIRRDLKQELADFEVDNIHTKLKNLEKDMVEILK